MARSLRPETDWTYPSDTPRYVWVGCTHGHARQVYPEHATCEPACEVCREPMTALTEAKVKRYLRDSRLCRYCKLGDHHLCTGVDCFGCDRSNHQRVPIDRVTWTEKHASSA